MPRTNMGRTGQNDAQKQTERVSKTQGKCASDIAQALFGKAYIDGISLNDLADMMGMSVQTVRARKRAPGNLSVNEIVQMCVALGVPVGAVFAGGAHEP